MMNRQRSTPDALLNAFLVGKEAERRELKDILRTRNFASEANVNKAIEFLSAAGLKLSLFENALEPDLKQDFLKSLICAWEIADATGTFNSKKLNTWSRINTFSLSCLEDIRKVAGSRISRNHRYWQEVARTGLVHIVELYRSQRMNRCIDELNGVLNFVETKLKGDELQCTGLLGQLYYFLSKANRYNGALGVAEMNLLQTMHYYSVRTERLVEEVRQLEKIGSSASSEKLLDARQKLVEIRLRTGVVEVSRAWLYFSQCNYKGAKHSAHTALLLLSSSGDELTQYHARLVSAAADRVTSTTAPALDRTVTKLTRIREYFREKRHARLQARTEFELLLALILLDSTLITGENKEIENKTPLAYAQKYLRQRFSQQPDRWSSLRMSLHSRLLRHEQMKKEVSARDFRGAISQAQEALKIAKNIHNPNAQIEALIALGEALIEDSVLPTKKTGTAMEEVETLDRNTQPNGQHGLTAVKEILSEALYLCNKANFPELTAIVRLLLARVAVRENIYDEADYHLHQFKRIILPEHAWIQRLHRKVFSEFRHEDHLILQESQFTKVEAFRELKRFLIQRAEKKASEEEGKITEGAVADLIGINRGTLTKWRNQIRNSRTA
jgi:tetratricopeptide (TPR) repeat protein